MKIELIIENVNILPFNINLNKMKEHERVKYDLPFTIKVDKKVYFYDEYFTILDFLYIAMKWCNDNHNSDMVYNSCDTDENPMLLFFYDIDGWIIKSPWENYEVIDKIKKEDLKKEIVKLYDIIIFKKNLNNLT